MCVTNTARRRPVAKLPKSALAGAAFTKPGALIGKSGGAPTKPGGANHPRSHVAVVGSGPADNNNGSLMAAENRRRAQEQAQQLLLRHRKVNGGGGGGEGGEGVCARTSPMAHLGINNPLNHRGRGRIPSIVARAVMEREEAKRRERVRQKQAAAEEEEGKRRDAAAAASGAAATAAAAAGEIQPSAAAAEKSAAAASSSDTQRKQAIGQQQQAPALLIQPSGLQQQSASAQSQQQGGHQQHRPPQTATTAYEHGTVTHAYHDHSRDSDPQTKMSTRGGVTCPFPTKLHAMLETIEYDGLGHVVSWQPHGRAFLVHNSRAFVEVVMPKYFKQTKMASFQRQLNLYGFQRITAGMDRGAYYHELFLRGMPYLAAKMTRTRVKGTGVRMASSPETEPNFYQMKPVSAELAWRTANKGSASANHQQPHIAPNKLNAGGGHLMIQSGGRHQLPPPPRHLGAPMGTTNEHAGPPLFSKSTLQSLMANPLARANPNALNVNEAVLRPNKPPPQAFLKPRVQPQPQLLSPHHQKQPFCAPAPPPLAHTGALTQAQQPHPHPVVTPCSVQRPRQTLEALQKQIRGDGGNNGGSGNNGNVSPATMPVPPPPLALSSSRHQTIVSPIRPNLSMGGMAAAQAGIAQQQQPRGVPSPPPALKLEHFIHRPHNRHETCEAAAKDASSNVRPDESVKKQSENCGAAEAKAPKDKYDKVKSSSAIDQDEVDQDQQEGGECGQGQQEGSGTPFEKSMMQYLHTLAAAECKDAALMGLDNCDDDDCCSEGEDTTAAAMAVSMEPLPFRLNDDELLHQRSAILNHLCSKQQLPQPPAPLDTLYSFPENEFVPPLAESVEKKCKGKGDEDETVVTAASTQPASSSNHSSSSSLESQLDGVAAVEVAADPEQKRSEEEKDEDNEDKDENNKPCALDGEQRFDIQVPDHEDNDTTPIPKHMLSPKSKEAEMDKFLEDLFFESRGGEGGGSGGMMHMDPLDPDDGMDLNDEALGYMLDDIVGA